MLEFCSACMLEDVAIDKGVVFVLIFVDILFCGEIIFMFLVMVEMFFVEIEQNGNVGAFMDKLKLVAR